MNRVDPLSHGQRNHVVDIEVGLDGVHPGTDEVGFLRLVPMEREPIFFRIDGDCPDAQFVGRSKDANRNLTAIRGQQAFDS